MFLFQTVQFVVICCKSQKTQIAVQEHIALSHLPLAVTFEVHALLVCFLILLRTLCGYFMVGKSLPLK